MSGSFKDVDPLMGLSAAQIAAAQQQGPAMEALRQLRALGIENAHPSLAPEWKQVDVMPFTRERTGRFGDMSMRLVLDSQDRLAALQLNGSLHHQEALKGLVAFLQELVR